MQELTRVHGSDTPFGLWLRNIKNIVLEKPDIAVSDGDFIIHQYLTEFVDAESRRTGKTRDIQAIMGIETKSRGAEPKRHQIEALFLLHSTSKVEDRPQIGPFKGITLRNFGWSFCIMSGTRPNNSKHIQWGRFNDDGRIIWIDVTQQQLADLCVFDRHPDNLLTTVFERHHKTQKIVEIHKTALGFDVPVCITKRS